MPECPECGSPPAPGQRLCRQCGTALPGWDLAASAYASRLQPDYDADWADDATVGASVRTPSLKFESPTMTSPQLLVGALSEEARTGGPQFGTGARATQPVGVAVPKDGAAKTPQVSAVRAPLWTPADAVAPPTGVDAQMPWRTLITLLVLALLVGGAYLGYPRAHTWWVARSVPGDLRAYMGGDGVQYSPIGGAYSVRLPKPPVQRNSTLTPTSTDTVWATMRRSIVAGTDYQIVIRVAQLRSGATLPFGLAGALVDPRIAGTKQPANVHDVEFGGLTASDYELGGDPPVHGRIFRSGARLFVVSVQAKGAERVLDELMRSFKPVAA